MFMFIHLSIGLYYEPKFIIENKHTYNEAVIRQLNFLKKEIHRGKADEMQKVFPEGFVFFNVIYGLTWCELISKSDAASSRIKEAITEIDWAIKEVNSDKGKNIFQENLPLKYGAFYQGWTALLIGKKLSLLDSNRRSDFDKEIFRIKCMEIAEAYETNGFSYLSSYDSGTWQGDNIICLASLALHDKLFTPKYQALINKCIEYIKADIDIKTGLIQHSTDEKYPRGSSQSLINVFLPDIDSMLAKQQYFKYKQHFLDRRLGLVCFREFPKGHTGEGDIDSGPVIWDVGAVASIVGIKAASIHKDYATSKSLRNNIEGLGYPIYSGQQKKYFFGTFPMADAFIAWVNVTDIESQKIEKEANNKVTFLLISVFSSTLILVVLYILWKR